MTFLYPTKETLKKQIEYTWATNKDYYIGFSSSPIVWSNGSESNIYIADSTATELIESNTNVRGYINGTDISCIYSESTASYEVLTKPAIISNTTTADIEYTNTFIAFGTEPAFYITEVAQGTSPAVLPANDGNVSRVPEILRFGPTTSAQLSRNRYFWSTNAEYSIGLFSNPSLIVDEFDENKVIRIEDQNNVLSSEITETLPGINGRAVFDASKIVVEQIGHQTIARLGSAEVTVENASGSYNFIGLMQDGLIIYGGYTEEPRNFKTEVFDITTYSDWQDGVVVI